MKKLLLLFSIATLLTGCFGIGESSDTPGGQGDPNFVTYDHTAFSIQVPKDWETIDSKSFTSNIPAETMVGFRNNIKNEVFTANVNVSMTKIPEEVTSADFGKSTLLKAKESLVGFKEISKEDYTLKYGDQEIATFTSGFEGKKTPADPIVRFKQLYIAYDGAGYVITSAYLPVEDETVVKNMDAMLHSFSLK